MGKIKRFMIENHGGNVEILKYGLNCCLKICEEERLNNLHILVGTNNQLKTGDLSSVLGRDICNRLFKGRKITSKNNLQISGSGISTFKTYSSFDLVFGLHLCRKAMIFMDSLENTKIIVFLPWNKIDGINWIETWDPIILGSNTWVRTNETLSSEAISRLEEMNTLINVSTGLVHTDDRKVVREVIKDIIYIESSLNPDLICQWAIKNGWSAKNAEELKKQAKKIIKV